MEGARRKRSPRWTRDQAKRELMAWARSGLTKTEYARTRGISVKRLWSWSGRLKKVSGFEAKPWEGDPPVLWPVRVVESRGVGLGEGVEGPSGIEVVMANGIRVRVLKGFDPATLLRVMEVVVRC